MLENIIAIIIILLLLAFVLIVYYIHVKKQSGSDDYVSSNPDTIESLTKKMSEIIVAIFKENLKDLNLTKKDYELRKKQKDDLRSSFKNASYGNKYSKAYIISFFRECLQSNPLTLVTRESVDKIIHFNSPSSLSPRDKWEILLFVYRNRLDENGVKYDDNALTTLIKNHNLNMPKIDNNGDYYYEITKEDINRVYNEEITSESLTFIDKLDIIANRIFADTRGFGAADTLFDSYVDEIDVGVSGIPSGSFYLRAEKNDIAPQYSYDSIWIMLSGVNIHLSFLGFGKQAELIRVCQNIYKYNASAYLSRNKGYIQSTMQDGSRVLVCRPPFSDSWAFFARKFDTAPAIDIKALYKEPGCEKLITLIKWIIKGNITIAITGEMGSGKTTLLKSLVGLIPRSYNLRIQEKKTELNLRFAYPDRNITSFQETDSISVQEGINTQKKTNGTVNVFGEVASAEEAVPMLQTTSVASKFGIFTHHANTAKELVYALRNNFLELGVFHSEKAAEEAVSKVINIDIHVAKDKHGNRYIERITEIIPIRDRRYPSQLEDKALLTPQAALLDQMEYQHRVTDRQLFSTENILEYKNGQYVITNDLSKELYDRIYNSLTLEEESSFTSEMATIKKGA